MHMATRLAGIMAVFLAGAALSGCPLDRPRPIFDASGGFGGDFEVSPRDASEENLRCRIAFELRQEVRDPFPFDFRIEGTVALNFACASTINALDELNVPALLGIEVLGAFTEQGRFTLAGAAQRGNLYYAIVMDGFGDDFSGDGAMDSFGGTLLLIVYNDDRRTWELLNLRGTFEAERTV